MADKESYQPYDPHEIEDKWYRAWEEQGLFHADENSIEPAFSMVIPPPNVTGSLHIGHALNNSLQDIDARYQRMCGKNVLWLPGTDHAGIATQHVVEKELTSTEGKTRHELGREEFLKRVWAWKEKYGNRILEQLKKLGASCDWERTRFTMDEGLSNAVKEVFVRLYEEGLIYTGEYMINWCPHCETALSDLEVETKEETGNLWYIRYPFADTSGSITVATTRPETMLGDTAVAVNPKDKRYKKFIGKKVKLPLTEREIPIIADERVEPTFGTGALKVTPAHDFVDFELAKIHKLEYVKAINEKGEMTKDAGKRYEGLERYKARELVVSDLKAQNLLEKIEDYKLVLGRCYRCREPVEPMVSKQWFVNTKPLAQAAIEAVKDKRVKIVPEFWDKTYFHWMENIRDWCISRQIWWGHRIPAWECANCKKYTVARETPKKCEHCKSENIKQVEDVLDTWFSSALWPFSTLGWPKKTKELELFYPTSLLITAFDILFFWVARMIMMGVHFMNDVPFRTVYIHALVRDEGGQKMSKTKGNVTDPIDMIDKYGADSLRFTLASMASPGRDIALAEDRIAGYRKFGNKIYNAVRFALMNLQDLDKTAPAPDEKKLSLFDRWILSRLSKVTQMVKKALDEYRFDEAASSIYHFLWDELCDWYIELVKPTLYKSDDKDAHFAAQHTLRLVIDGALRLLHPFMPFLTEELWQKLPGTCGSIMKASFVLVDARDDESAELDMKFLMELVSTVRAARAELGLALGAKFDIAIKSKGHELELIKKYAQEIMVLARLGSLESEESLPKPKGALTRKIEGAEIYIPIVGLLDVSLRLAKLKKELEQTKKYLASTESRLANEQFLSSAPESEVLRVRRQKAEAQTQLEKLSSLIEELESLV